MTNKRILIVAQKDPIRDALRNQLEQAGFDVDTTANTTRAEDMVATTPINLLVVDISVSTQDGWDVFGLASAVRPLLPVILICDEDEFRQVVPAVGFVLVCKPINPEAFIKRVTELLTEPSTARLKRLAEQSTGMVEANAA